LYITDIYHISKKEFDITDISIYNDSVQKGCDEMIEILKVIIFGIVEGITEWLPISSTGHMILLDEFIKLDVSPEFWDLFLVVIQLGAIIAVVFLYWDKLFPFTFSNGINIDKKKFSMWFKILVASVPAGIVGVLWDDVFNDLFYNYITVAIMLIIFGVLFIGIEKYQKDKLPKIASIAEITYSTAFIIGVFQLIAAVFPGTSRSGATILGALLLGVSRSVAAEFTFFLAIPAMFGGSAIKLLKAGIAFTAQEWLLLLIGMIVAFMVSIVAIKFLVSYIKKNDFKVFGWYRIVLGILVFAYFIIL
jgi:undecaprenyl-diphosphatase